jgi:hypothetical protein
MKSLFLMRSIKTFKFKNTTGFVDIMPMHVKVIEGRSSNYRVDDCDWLIARKSNVWRM